jgi:methyl-accepting chemotaxis protein/methyl-accepting chemotaxis protein-1 (serine sensor receptor)
MNEWSSGIGHRLAAGHAVTLTLAAATILALWSGAHAAVTVWLTAALAAAVIASYLWCLSSVKHLRRLISTLGAFIQQVASAGTQVASASQSLAQGASEQAATIQRTSSTGRQVSDLARTNSVHSKSAASLVGNAETTVTQALGELEQMVMAMVEINGASMQVAKITKVIDEIAFQTNILALNAAVEAARAGESGLGFAVVADEVRNLARRAADASRDIAGLIDQSIARVSQGTSKLDQVAQGVGAIVDSTSKAKSLVDEVQQGSAQQAEGLQQVARSLAQIEQATQQAAANAEEGAAAAEELASQTAQLTGTLDEILVLAGRERVQY